MADDNPTTQVEYRELAAHVGYRFGDDGTVWSRWKATGKSRDKGVSGWALGDDWHRVKVSTTTRRGRPYLSLFSRRRKTFVVSRLILEAFVGPCPEGMECRHLNGDPSDNRLTNLCWGTHQENMDDKIGHGTKAVGERIGNAKFTERDIREIRSRRDAGETTRSLAEAFNTDNGNISRIVRRLTWKHI